MKTLLFLAWRNLFRNPRRTLASLLTVALGSAGLLIYQAFNTGIMNQYRENTIHGYYGYGQVYPAGSYDRVHEKPWEHWIQDPDAVEAKLREIPQVKDVFPRLTVYAFLVKGGITLGGKGQGVLPERESRFFDQMNFIEGHDLQGDEDVILGRGLAKSLGAHVGDTVTILTQTTHGQLNGADLKVSGIFHMGKKIIDDSFFRMPLKVSQQLLDTKSVELFSLATTGVDSWPTIASQLKTKDASLEAIPFEILDKIYYQNAVDFLSAQFAFIRVIILIIVALGIFNTIAVALLERAGEIGALRANGESRKRIALILFMENLILGCAGGALGICIAVMLDRTLLVRGIPMPPGPGTDRMFMIFLQMLPGHYISALLLPAVTAALASLWPIRRLLMRSIPDLLRSH